MINEYLYENKANMYAVVVPSGTIKVKKYVALENGKYDLVGTKVNKKIKPRKRFYFFLIFAILSGLGVTYAVQLVWYITKPGFAPATRLTCLARV